mgnify:FL=1
MKKISVLIISALLLANICPVQAGVLTAQRNRIEQNRIYKTTYNDIKAIIDQQAVYTNKYDLDGLSKLYSENFVNSDGFNKEVYFKLIKETWDTYPDIIYKTQINNIEFSDNYATVTVNETAIATSTEKVGEISVIGELYSTSKCVYFLEKQGSKWLINSEKIINETSTLKYGDARYTKIELNAPKQIGANQDYTSTLKVKAPKDTLVIASINKENIIYPQTKSNEAFRKLPEDNILERVFHSNSNNVNEYTVASIGITRAENYTNNQIRVYMGGLAFIMTRVNVIPENKFVKIENENESKK